MVIVRIIGGLGNQLFQFAAARSLAMRCGTEVKVDVSGFSQQALRQFDLLQMQTPVSVATQAEIDEVKAKGMLARVAERLKPAHRKQFYKEPHFQYDPSFNLLKAPVYIQGYFQSEKYFLPIEKEIRRAYCVAPGVVQKVVSFGDELASGSSVSLHIRRGDYGNPTTLRVHGILSPDYYRTAISRIRETVDHPRFFIFTDDSAWVRTNLDIPKATLVSGFISNTHFEDLYLMTRCRHNITANSSFSWWGAWLNANPDKVVVAPDRWFNEGPADTGDLLPGTWLRV
jgi:hypothetical protein